MTDEPADDGWEGRCGARRGRLFVVSGPSGVGKDAMLDATLGRLAGVARSVSATTRPPRPGEVDGVDYCFMTRSEFERDAQAGLFFEYAEYNGCLYGTPRGPVESRRADGVDVVLKIEVKGARSVRTLEPDAVMIFIQPPSLDVLENRLRSRATDSEERIRERLAVAMEEMRCIPTYDYLVTNDVLEDAVDLLRSIILAERHRVPRD